MPALDYQFDPTAVDPDNLIENEVHDVIDRGIFTLHGAFYKEGLVVEGYDGVAWSTLVDGEDFTYSPLFLSVSAATGRQAFSYLVLLGVLHDEYEQVRLTYQAVGTYEDVNLLSLVTELTAPERELRSKWLALSDIYQAPISVRSPELYGKSLIEIISNGLGNIDQAIRLISALNGGSILSRLEAFERIVNAVTYWRINMDQDDMDLLSIDAPMVISNENKTATATLLADGSEHSYGQGKGDVLIPITLQYPSFNVEEGKVGLETTFTLSGYTYNAGSPADADIRAELSLSDFEGTDVIMSIQTKMDSNTVGNVTVDNNGTLVDLGNIQINAPVKVAVYVDLDNGHIYVSLNNGIFTDIGLSPFGGYFAPLIKVVESDNLHADNLGGTVAATVVVSSVEFTAPFPAGTISLDQIVEGV